MSVGQKIFAIGLAVIISAVTVVGIVSSPVYADHSSGLGNAIDNTCVKGLVQPCQQICGFIRDPDCPTP